MKIEYCLFDIEYLASIMSKHLIITHYKQHRAELLEVPLIK